MCRYYEARASLHDQYMGYRSNEDMEKLLSPIIRHLEGIITGKRVLEIACGTGNWTEILAKRAESVVAVDVSPAVLSIARSKLSDYNNVSFVHGDAYGLDDIRDSFEVLFSADWWSHVPKGVLPEFLDSTLKKLRPGSKAVFIDMSFREYFRQESCYYDKENNRVSLRKLPDGSEFLVVKNFPSESELRDFLANYTQDITYHEFELLQRWMIIFSVD